MCHQAVYRVFLLGDSGLRTILRPECFGTRQGFRLFNNTFGFGESFVGFGSRRKGVVAVIRYTAGKNTVLSFGQFKLNSDTFMIEQTCAVFSALKFLFEQHVVYKVQVYLFGKVEYGTFNKVSRVERHIQVSVETERLGIKRCESKVCTRLSSNLQRVHQVIFIKACADTGQGTDKLICKQGNVVFVDIDVFKDFIDGCLHPLFRKKLIDTGLFAPFHPLLLGTGRFPVIVCGKQFTG